MKTLEQIQKKKAKLEKRLDKLRKYRKKIDFMNVYDVRASVAEHEEYTKEIMLLQGKIDSLNWTIGEK